jgi:hypothetical protein
MTMKKEDDSEQQIAQRRDEALRRTLNTPPKQHKDMKKGKARFKHQEPSSLPTKSGGA